MTKKDFIRKVLLTQPIPTKNVRTVDIREITFNPGQIAGLHKHPCPVFGVILEGEVLFQVEGEREQNLRAGDAFYEPENSLIIHFDNTSGVKQMKFVACYLINHEKQLIEMLQTSIGEVPPSGERKNADQESKDHNS